MLMDMDYGLRMFDSVYIIRGFSTSFFVFSALCCLWFRIIPLRRVPYPIFSHCLSYFHFFLFCFHGGFAFNGYTSSPGDPADHPSHRLHSLPRVHFVAVGGSMLAGYFVRSGFYRSGSGHVGCICEGCLFPQGCWVEDIHPSIVS